MLHVGVTFFVVQQSSLIVRCALLSQALRAAAMGGGKRKDVASAPPVEVACVAMQS